MRQRRFTYRPQKSIPAMQRSYDKQNLRTAAEVLDNIDAYGGVGSGMHQWAVVVVRRLQAQGVGVTERTPKQSDRRATAAPWATKLQAVAESKAKADSVLTNSSDGVAARNTAAPVVSGARRHGPAGPDHGGDHRAFGSGREDSSFTSHMSYSVTEGHWA